MFFFEVTVKMGWKEYFPYEPRLGQEDIADFVTKNIKEQGVCVVEAPYGIGKSISMLSAALASGKKVIFATCNNSAQNSIVDEVLRINQKLGKNLSVAGIVAKSKSCLQQDFTYDLCDQLKKDKLCKYYSKTYGEGKGNGKELTPHTKKAMDEIEFTVKKRPFEIMHKPFSRYVNAKALEHGICPYELMMQLAQRADVIILDYFYMFTDLFPLMKKRLGLDPKNTILFVDEADELKDRILSDLTIKVSSIGLQRLREQVKKVPGITDKEVGFMTDLFDSFNEMFSGKEGHFDLDKAKIMAMINMTFGNYDEFLSTLTNIITRVSKNFERVAARPENFFELLQDLPETQFCYGFKNKDTKAMMISYYELQNATIMYIEGRPYRVKDLFEDFHASIMFSATIGNVEIFKRGVGVEYADFFSSNKFNTDKFKIILKRDMTSLYKTRKETASKVVQDVKFCEDICGSVLLALPAMNTTYDIVPHVNGKSLDNVNECKKGVYYAVLGGRSSRGINKAHNLNMVYIYGLQLPQMTDYLFQKRRDYMLKKYDQEIAYKFLYSTVVSKACQTAGRIFRRRDKKGLIVFADSRYRWDYMQKDFFYKCFPSYFKDKIVETTNLKQFQDTVSAFWGKLVFA